VRYVYELKKNLLFVSMFDELGYVVDRSEDQSHIDAWPKLAPP